MTETIEDLEARITNIEGRLDIVVHALSIICDHLAETERSRIEMHDVASCHTVQLQNDIAYLEDGDII